MKRSILSTLAVLAALSTGSSLHALQDECSDLDGVPRSNLRLPPLEGEPLIDCITNCKKVGPGEFRNCVCTKNTSPFNIWIVSCIQNTNGSWLYTHHDVPPGGLVWAYEQTSDAQWSWITTWAIIPPFPGEFNLELAASSITFNDDGTLTADTAGTVQARHLPGVIPQSREVEMLPIGGSPWSRSTQLTPQAGGMQIDEDWDGQGDLSIDQNVETFLVSGVGSLQFTQAIDRGKDGSVDHTSHLNFWQDEDGTMHLELQAYDGQGNLESAFYATKMMAAGETSMTTIYDHDGDRVSDQVDFETIEYRGLSSETKLTRDFGADGRIDETELRSIQYRGLRDASQSITTLNADGLPFYSFEDEMTPVPGGYLVDGRADLDGDGLFDRRQAQLSMVGPFAGGLDEDYLGIDADNNGTWDSLSHMVTLKSMQAGLYTELIGTDAGSDGILDGIVQRNETLIP